VVLPAAYSNVIAVAGCGPDGRPWIESLRGPNVDITAPADAVWVAELDPRDGNSVSTARRTETLESASGTSFAAAFMAGVAALWLAHHDRVALLARYPGVPLAWVFRHQLQRTADAAFASDWDTQRFGPGIVNVEALLREPLPPAGGVTRPPATVPNALTEASSIFDSPMLAAAADAWALIWDAGEAVVGALTAAGAAVWAVITAAAEALIDFGRELLTTLTAAATLAAGAVGQAIAATVAVVSDLVTAAAEVAADTVDAVADSVDEAVAAVEDVVEDTADAVGEGAEAVWNWLTGWAA
jgi:hypothetical protein